MVLILATLNHFDNFVGGLKCDVEPTNKTEYQQLITNKDNWLSDKLWNGTPKTWEQVLAKQSELETKETSKTNLKASAKAKLIAGEKLTEEEADILIGV